MVAIAQLVEHSVVVRAVTGSSPVGHPIKISREIEGFLFWDDVNKKNQDCGFLEGRIVIGLYGTEVLTRVDFILTFLLVQSTL